MPSSAPEFLFGSFQLFVFVDILILSCIVLLLCHETQFRRVPCYFLLSCVPLKEQSALPVFMGWLRTGEGFHKAAWLKIPRAPQTLGENVSGCVIC